MASTLSLTNTNDRRKYQYLHCLIGRESSIRNCHFPYHRRKFTGNHQNEQLALVQIEEAIFIKIKIRQTLYHHQNIQAEGGDNHFRDEFLRRIKKNLRRKRKCVSIFDEVQTGIGITGKMWAFQNYSVVPE